MKTSKYFILLAICASVLALAQPALAQLVGTPTVQTNSATNISANQATLNGYFGIPYLQTGTSYFWFQWGPYELTYGNETTHQSTTSNNQNFSQALVSLSPNTTYHYRTVLQTNNGTFYGPDVSFATTNNSDYTNSTLSVTKQAINLTSGNLNWQNSITANPDDVISFAIILRAGSQDAHNVFVRDMLPPNLSYIGRLIVNSNLNSWGDPQVGINIGTIPANGVAVVSYQARVAPGSSLPYGSTTLSSSATITSQEMGTQTVSSQVLVNNSWIAGNSNITNVPTGLTNNPFKDSFFFPLAGIILFSWLYFTGKIKKFMSF